MPYPWSAGNVLTATDLNSALAAKTDLAMVQNAQTGSSYSYALADASKLLTMSNASANTVLVTKQATVTWVTGAQLRVMNLGAGVTTLVADTGVTINGNVALKQYQGGTLIRTASDVWLFVPTSSSGGMDLITPTSVAGTGVTLSGGQVSFSAATTVSVNGCFSSVYENYRIIISATSTIGSNIYFRFRISGTDSSTNYICRLSTLTTTYATSVSSTQMEFGVFRSVPGAYFLDISRPNIATGTSFSSYGIDPDVAASTLIANGRQSDSTQFDGFTFFGNAGSMSGTVRTYGLRNS